MTLMDDIEQEDLVIVVWKDAIQSMDVPIDPMTVTSVGFLVERDSEKIVVAMERFEDGTFRQFLSVPAGMVIRLFSLVMRGAHIA